MKRPPDFDYNPKRLLEPESAAKYHHAIGGSFHAGQQGTSSSASTTTCKGKNNNYSTKPLSDITNHTTNNHPTQPPSKILTPTVNKSSPLTQPTSQPRKSLTKPKHTESKQKTSSKPTHRICPHCRKSFAHSSSLSRHVKTFHDGRGDTGNISCNVCDSRYVHYAIYSYKIMKVSS